MPFKLVVWDFDGTLADSVPTAAAIFNRLAPDMGFKPIEDLTAARSLSTRQFLKQHGISLWRLPKLVRRYQAAAAEEADRLKLVAGVPDVLAALASAGVRLGVLSSNREDNIRRCLRANGAEQHFAFVVGWLPAAVRQGQGAEAHPPRRAPDPRGRAVHRGRVARRGGREEGGREGGRGRVGLPHGGATAEWIAGLRGARCE